MKQLVIIAVAGAGMAGSAGACTIITPTPNNGLTEQMYRDEAALYPMVGKVTGSGYNGSGVVISDRWVLTAGHVSLSKTNGTFTVGGVDYRVQSVVTHPSFTFTGPAYDVGLLYLTTSISGVAAAEMVHFGSDTEVLGMQATWVGHGLGGTGLTGAQAPLGFRAFTNIIDVLGTEYGLSATSVVADFDNPDGSGNASGSAPGVTRLEGNLAAGDSGGGVFATVDGRTRLVGINSYAGGFVQGSNSKYGSLSGAANLNLFHAWITEKTGVAVVPEPGVIALVGVGALALWRRRRACASS